MTCAVTSGPVYASTASPWPETPAPVSSGARRRVGDVEMPGPRGVDAQAGDRVGAPVHEAHRERPVVAAERLREHGDDFALRVHAAHDEGVAPAVLRVHDRGGPGARGQGDRRGPGAVDRGHGADRFAARVRDRGARDLGRDRRGRGRPRGCRRRGARRRRRGRRIRGTARARAGGGGEREDGGRDDPSPTLTAVTTRHPLQPKDWKSGSHTERFERVRRYVEGRTVLDIGAGSGIDRPDWMHASVAAVASEAVGVELDADLAARARERGLRRGRRRRADPRSRAHVRGGLGGRADRAPVVRGRLPRRGAGAPRLRRAARAHDAERLRRLELRVPHRWAPTRQPGPHVLVRRDDAVAAAATPRLRSRRGRRTCGIGPPDVCGRCSRARCDRCYRSILPRTRCSWSRLRAPEPEERSRRQNLRLTGVITSERLRFVTRRRPRLALVVGEPAGTPRRRGTAASTKNRISTQSIMPIDLPPPPEPSPPAALRFRRFAARFAAVVFRRLFARPRPLRALLLRGGTALANLGPPLALALHGRAARRCAAPALDRRLRLCRVRDALRAALSSGRVVTRACSSERLVGPTRCSRRPERPAPVRPRRARWSSLRWRRRGAAQNFPLAHHASFPPPPIPGDGPGYGRRTRPVDGPFGPAPEPRSAYMAGMDADPAGPASSDDPAPGHAARSLDYSRLYEFRFKDVDQDARQAVWNEIAQFLWKRMGRPRPRARSGRRPRRVRERGARRGALARRRRRLPRAPDRSRRQDRHRRPVRHRAPGRVLRRACSRRTCSSTSTRPKRSPRSSSACARRSRRAACSRSWARTSSTAPTSTSTAPTTCSRSPTSRCRSSCSRRATRCTEVVPRFLPFSFRSRLPASPALTRLYLRTPVLWRLQGKQFLILATPLNAAFGARGDGPFPGAGTRW